MTLDWNRRKLGEVISLEYGKPLPKEKRYNDGVYPAYGANGIKCHTNMSYWDKPSIIVGRKGSAGQINLVDGGFWPLDVTYYVTYDETRYDLKFLFYMLSTLNLQGLAKGVKPGINRNDVYAIEQLFPPLHEQKRIVTILDEAFAGIEKAVANTENNLANARELFESYLDSVFFVKCPATHRESLAKLCEPKTITYGVIKLGQHRDDGVPCLRTSNVRRLNIETEGMKRIAPELSHQYGRTILQGGEVLVNIRGTLGGVAVAGEDMKGWNVSREVAVVPLDQKRILPSFAAYCIATKASQDWLVGVQKGVAYTGINLTDLRELPIYLPELNKQASIVAQLDEMYSHCCALELLHQQKLAALAELKQSLLQKAFSGELTANANNKLKEAAA